jgi:GT2 family glycosyltransferase
MSRQHSFVVGVPIRNQLPFVRLCMASLFAFNHPNTRILLVDDGSETPTQEYLVEISGRPGVTLLRNERPRGVPYCFNEILYNSSEEEICFLNSDTLVTPQWDVHLSAVIESSQEIGMTGPSTSFTHTEQSLPGLLENRMSQDSASASQIAHRVYQFYRGQLKVLRTLGGFCLAVRRDVVRKIGYFDECFGIGAAEEDDFIARARDAGFLPVWVKYAYVHHFGHCTMTQELKGASAELWRKNRLIFEIKRLTPGLPELVHTPGANSVRS